MKLLNKFYGLVAVLFFTFSLASAQTQIDPTLQIQWPLATGAGAPTESCTSLNYGQPYTDVLHNLQYFCGAAGWSITGPPTSGVYVVDGITYTNFAAAETACLDNATLDEQNFRNGIGTVAQPGCTIFAKNGAHGASIDTMAGPIAFQIGCNGTTPSVSCTGMTSGQRCQTVGTGTIYQNCYDVSVAEYLGPWGDFTRPGPVTYSSYLTQIGDSLGNASSTAGHGTVVTCTNTAAQAAGGCWNQSLWSIANNDYIANISFLCAPGNTQESAAWLDYGQQAPGTGGFTDTVWSHVSYQNCYGDTLHFGGSSNESATPWQQSSFYDVQVIRPCPYTTGANAGIGAGFAAYFAGNGGSDNFTGGVYSTQPCATPGSGASAVAVLSGQSVTGFTSVVGGTGFTTGCTIKIQGNGCVGVTASCSVSAGSAVPTLLTGGLNCQGVPAVTITPLSTGDTMGPNGGTNVYVGSNNTYLPFTATSYSILNNVVTGYLNLIGGVCTGTPTVTVNGSGSGASFTATVTGGTVTSLTEVSGGSGYTGTTTFSFSGVCNGTSATPVVTPGVLTEVGYGVVPIRAGQFLHFPITGTTGAWTTSPATSLNNTTPQVTSVSSSTVGTCPGATCGQVQQTITFNTNIGTPVSSTPDVGVAQVFSPYYGVVGTVGTSAFTISSNGTTAIVTVPTTVPLPDPVWIYINGCQNASLTALNGHVWETSNIPVYGNYTSSTNGTFYPGVNATITFPWSTSVSQTTDTCVGYVESANSAAPFALRVDKAIIEGASYLGWIGGGNYNMEFDGDHSEGGGPVAVTNGWTFLPNFVAEQTVIFHDNLFLNNVARNSSGAYLFNSQYATAPLQLIVTDNTFFTPMNVFIGNCNSGTDQTIIFENNNSGTIGNMPGPSCGFISSYSVPTTGTSIGSVDPGPAHIIAIQANASLCYVPMYIYPSERLLIKELSTTGSIVGPNVLPGCSYQGTAEAGNFNVNVAQQGNTTYTYCQGGYTEWTPNDQTGLWDMVSAPSCPSLNLGFPYISACTLPSSPSSGTSYNLGFGLSSGTNTFCPANTNTFAQKNLRASTIGTMNVTLGADPGNGNTVQVLLNSNGGSTALTCTVTGSTAGTSRTCSYVGNISAVANGLLYFSIVPTFSTGFPSSLAVTITVSYQ